MNSLPELKPLTTHILRPVSVCSQFVKLNGKLGWLTAPDSYFQNGYEFRKAFEVEILPWREGLLSDLQSPTQEEIAQFHRQRRNVDAELAAYYSRETYSGD